MKLQIGEHKITSDGTCVTLTKSGVFGEKSKKAGEAYEKIIGHYPNLEQALMRLLEEKVAGGQGETVADMINGIRAAKNEIVCAVRGCDNSKRGR